MTTRPATSILAKQPGFKFAFLALDILVLWVSFGIASSLAIKELHFPASCFHAVSPGSMGFTVMFVIVSLMAFLYNNLYKRNVVITIYRQTVLICKSMLITMVLVSFPYLVCYSFGVGLDEFRRLVFGYAGCCLVLSVLLRAVVARRIFLLLVRKKLLQSRVLIVGGDEAARAAGNALHRAAATDLVIAGFVDDGKAVGEKVLDEHSNLGTLDDLQKVVNLTDPDEILVAIDDIPYEKLIAIVEKSLRTGKVVRVYSNFLKVIADRINVEFYADIPVVMLSQKPLSDISWRLKRVVDILMSVAAILALSPVFLLIAIGIKASSPGPVIFKQRRIGKDGRAFDFYKFRSMHAGTGDDKHREFVRDFIKGEGQPEDGDIRVFKITKDPRIFPFGKFIRKTSLDEFPQLYNVLKGDMTLVGPRPCLPYEWEHYSAWHRNRLNVLPGCTGLWQAVGRSRVTFQEMVILDLYYISNMSLWLDLKIVLQTIPVVFLGKGGH